ETINGDGLPSLERQTLERPVSPITPGKTLKRCFETGNGSFGVENDRYRPQNPLFWGIFPPPII
ncbi:MAG: hypothetical protein ABI876_10175, partial [Bacteroidota bacterium]